MAREIAVTQARDVLADLVNRVAYGNERVILTRHGRPVAALVSPSDLAALEQPQSGQQDTEQAIRLTGTDESAKPRQQADHAQPWRIAAEHTPGTGRDPYA